MKKLIFVIGFLGLALSASAADAVEGSRKKRMPKKPALVAPQFKEKEAAQSVSSSVDSSVGVLDGVRDTPGDRLLQGLPAWLYLAGSGTLGWSWQPVAEEQTTPFLLNGGLGFDVAYQLTSHWGVGLLNQVEWVNQYSEVMPGVGNRRGIAFNFSSPGVYYLLTQSIRLAGNVRWLGDYLLWENTPTGVSVSYGGVWGLKGRAFYAILPAFDVGVSAEYGRYSTLSLSSGMSRQLSDQLNYWNLGLVLQARL